MEKKEKVEFILEQMRLCLAKKDFIRTQIISKKINTKYFDDTAAGVTVSSMTRYMRCFCKFSAIHKQPIT